MAIKKTKLTLNKPTKVKKPLKPLKEDSKKLEKEFIERAFKVKQGDKK